MLKVSRAATQVSREFSRVRLRELREELVARHDRQIATPWKIDNAHADFIGKMIGGISGIEIDVTRPIGKWEDPEPAVGE